jgi:hypothetical protein
MMCRACRLGERYSRPLSFSSLVLGIATHLQGLAYTLDGLMVRRLGASGGDACYRERRLAVAVIRADLGSRFSQAAGVTPVRVRAWVTEFLTARSQLSVAAGLSSFECPCLG